MHWPEFSMVAESLTASAIDGVNCDATSVFGPPVDAITGPWKERRSLATSREQVKYIGHSDEAVSKTRAFSRRGAAR